MNLGFVGNCNRVVLELDTTGNDVLLLNSDTIVTAGFLDEMAERPRPLALPRCGRRPQQQRHDRASIPHRRGCRASPARSPLGPRVHAVVVDAAPPLHGRSGRDGLLLPHPPRADRPVRALRRAFAPGYGEENDFCLRINEHGLRVAARQPGARLPHRLDELLGRPRPRPAVRPREGPDRALPALRRRPRPLPGARPRPDRQLRRHLPAGATTRSGWPSTSWARRPTPSCASIDRFAERLSDDVVVTSSRRAASSVERAPG